MSCGFRALTFLGTSSGTPTAYRNVSSYAVTLSDGGVWLFDCGEGTQHQLLKCSAVSRGKIDRIFVTHLHGDHSFGLPGLISSIGLMWTPRVPCAPSAASARSAAGEGELQCDRARVDVDEDDEEDFDAPKSHGRFSQRSQFLELVGPRGLGAFLRGAFLTSQTRFGFQYRVTELLPPPWSTPCTPEGTLAQYEKLMSSLRHPDEAPPRFITATDEGAYDDIVERPLADDVPIVRAAELSHRVFCVGYVLTERDSPGALNMERVAKLGVPKGPLLAKLKQGKPVTFDVCDSAGVVTERTVQAAEVVSAPLPGRSLVLLGDTCDSSRIASLVQRMVHSVDWVVHESTFGDEHAALAVPRGHSTAAMAGSFAAGLRAKNLVLTHFSARFPSMSKCPEAIQALIEQARQCCPDVCVHAADDFTSFDLTRSASKTRAEPRP